jgi:hypothetical protein
MRLKEAPTNISSKQTDIEKDQQTDSKRWSTSNSERLSCFDGNMEIKDSILIVGIFKILSPNAFY